MITTHPELSRPKTAAEVCEAKLRFLSRRDAKRSAAGARRHHGQPLHVYLCATCGGFHVGHRLHAVPLILCADCGRPWRPRVHRNRDGEIDAMRDVDPTRCATCQPKQEEK